MGYWNHLREIRKYIFKNVSFQNLYLLFLCGIPSLCVMFRETIFPYPLYFTYWQEDYSLFAFPK